MKKKKLITLIVLLIIIIIILGFYFKRYKDYGMYGVFDSSYRVELDKLNKIASVDHCVNNIYTNDYIGISLKCPDELMAQEFNSGIVKTYKEGVNFIEKKDKINVRNNRENIFSIRLNYEKFDPNNHSEFISIDNKLYQKEIYNFAKKVEAALGPTLVKIEDIKLININENQYYVYSYTVENNRTDAFIIPLENSYIKFKFNNQKVDFIKNVLNSVTRIDGPYSNIGDAKINNLKIGLSSVVVPKDWSYVNNDNSLNINYSGVDGKINILISNEDVSQNKLLSQIMNYDTPNRSSYDMVIFEKSIGCNVTVYLNNKNIKSCLIHKNDGSKEIFSFIKGTKNIFIKSTIDKTADKKYGSDRVLGVLNSIIIAK